MPLSFKIIRLLIIVSLFLSSCEKDFEPTIALPPAGPFATCFLTNTSDKISLHYLKAISLKEYGNYESISNASVVIENAGPQYQMLYDSTTETYRIDTSIIPIKAGMHYKITITNSDGSSLDASTSVPFSFLPTINFIASQHSNSYEYSISFVDSSMEEKYMLLQFITALPCQFTGCNDTDYYVLKSLPIFKSAYQLEVQMNIGFSVDQSRYSTLQLGNNYGLQLKSFIINRDMYLYFNSVNANLAASSDPHAAPSPIYSNFSGGNGIFGPIIGE